MAISRTTSSVNVEITPALPEHEPVLANLLEFYAHDFSEFIDLKIGEDGRFGYEHLPLYWKESSRNHFSLRLTVIWLVLSSCAEVRKSRVMRIFGMSQNSLLFAGIGGSELG